MNDIGREDLVRAEDHQFLAARGDVGVVAFDLRLASLDPGHPERVAHKHLAQQELGAAAHVGDAVARELREVDALAIEPQIARGSANLVVVCCVWGVGVDKESLGG